MEKEEDKQQTEKTTHIPSLPPKKWNLIFLKTELSPESLQKSLTIFILSGENDCRYLKMVTP